VAGDDTVLIVTKDHHSATRVASQLMAFVAGSQS
jgi:arginine repressor